MNFIHTRWRRKDTVTQAASLLSERVIRMPPKARVGVLYNLMLRVVCLYSHFQFQEQF